ncbi:hypothetical protein [Ruegeria atlantica]|uniref:hypothetical protein n=1 Tax=Ruegeria atlantica TaxID=81569 RepID=UPI0024959A6D|nr:hypothetical protein [Ruegeria atlantica]
MNAQIAETTMSQAQISAQLVEQNDGFRKREPAGSSGHWVFTTAIDNEGPESLRPVLRPFKHMTG